MTVDQMSAELAAELAANNVRRLVDPRGIPVRFSRLRQMAKSALHYFSACQDVDNDTLAKRLGRGAHALVLGQPIAVWDAQTDSGRARPRNGKDWDEFRAANVGAEILNAKEYEQSKAIADAVLGHPIAGPMISGSQLELAIDWTHELGRKCQSHFDIYRRGAFVADLKTARDASPDRFSHTSYWSHYHAQLAFYVEAVESIERRTPDALVIAVENQPPYPVTVMKLDADALEAGRRQCRLWMEQVLVCEASGQWPAYAQTVVPLSLPESASQFTLVVDGDDIQL